LKRRIILALVLVGFTSMAAQIVLMRELLVVFYGNELSIGIVLAGWLFWVAFGSLYIGRWIADKIKARITVFSACEVILSFLLPASIIAARLIPLIFKFSPGEIIGVFPMSVATFVLLSAVCILAGFLFVLGCRIYSDSLAADVQIGNVYILEAIGATVGGLITSLLLIRIFSSLYIMFLVGFLNLAAAFLLLWKEKKILNFSAGIILAVFALTLVSGRIDSLRKFSLNWQWRGYELLASENSVYGNIAVTRRYNLYSIFINGLYNFSIPDRFSSERNVHFPLLEHHRPKDILLIGGGSSGQLKELLKHPVENVDYVELDPLLIDLAKRYLPANEALDDPRVRVITDMDGRLFIKRSDKRYDAVIINLPEPHTAQLNRFYTREFYVEVEKVLKDKGIVSFCLYSNPNYISQEQAQLYSALKKTLESVFKDVKITPGEANLFLASKEEGALTLDWRILMQRLKQRNIEATYMREYYLYSELSRERIDSFRRQLAQSGSVTINRDFHPIAYYYDIVLWNTYFKYSLKRIFKAISPRKIYTAAAIFFCIFLFIPLCIRKIPNFAVLTCVGTTGFAEMSFQIVNLLAFQILYGYLYYKLGIILTSYMLGLILGGWLITKRLKKQIARYRLFLKTQVAIFIYPLILPFLFWVFSVMKGKFSFLLGSNFVFPLLPIIAGFIGGFQFPLANSLYIKATAAKAGYSAGLTYGIDLFGSCAGAIFTSVFLMPIIGIPMTCILVAGLNLVGLMLLLRAKNTLS